MIKFPQKHLLKTALLSVFLISSSSAFATGGTLFGGGLSWGFLANSSDFATIGDAEELGVSGSVTQFGFGASAHFKALKKGLGYRVETYFTMNYARSESFSDPEVKIFNQQVVSASKEEQQDDSVEGYLQYGFKFRNFVTYPIRFNKTYYMYMGPGLGFTYGADAARDTPGWDSGDDAFFALTLPITVGGVMRLWKRFAFSAGLVWDTVLAYQRGMFGDSALSWGDNFGMGLDFKLEFVYIY